MKRALVSIIILSALTVCSLAQDDATVNKTGDKAPLFTIQTIDGQTVDLSKMKGKVVMINFFATWCGPCNQELPVLQKEVWGKYKKNQDFVLIVIGREHSEAELKDFAARKGLSLPFAPDPKREIFSMYARQNIPRNIIIDRDGKIIFQSTGYTPEEFRQLTDLLAKELKK